MNRAGRIAIGIAALVGLQLGGWWIYRRVESRRTIGPVELERATGPAPGVALTLLREDGTTLRLQQLEGRPIVLHFWASWCGPCRDELPTLLELSASLDDSVAVLLVSVDEGWGPIQLFFDGNVPSAVVLDETAALRGVYGTGPLPETWLIDADGQLQGHATGARDWQSTALRDRIRALTVPRATR